MSAPTLTEFLLARIAEDESGDDAQMVGATRKNWSVRWTAECEAKRRIVEEHRDVECSNVRCNGSGVHCQTCDEGLKADYGHVYAPCPTLRHLAAVYSDHPDYRQEWKP